jgi:hypothetical protein
MNDKKIVLGALTIAVVVIIICTAYKHGYFNKSYGSENYGVETRKKHDRPKGWGSTRNWYGGYDDVGYPYFFWDHPFAGPVVDIVYPDNFGPQCVEVDKFDQCDILRPNKRAVDTLGRQGKNMWQCCATRKY